MHPSSKRSYFLKTAACLYILPCSLLLISAVECPPFAYLSLSSLAIVSSPASAAKSFYVYPGVYYSTMVLAALLPKITKSRRELAPSLFAPCTEAEAASPHALRPGTRTSLPFSS